MALRAVAGLLAVLLVEACRPAPGRGPVAAAPAARADTAGLVARREPAAPGDAAGRDTASADAARLAQFLVARTPGPRSAGGVRAAAQVGRCSRAVADSLAAREPGATFAATGPHRIEVDADDTAVLSLQVGVHRGGARPLYMVACSAGPGRPAWASLFSYPPPNPPRRP